jgi:hypothetical protein
MYITANYMNLNAGQSVEVSIDAKSFDGNYIYLTNAGPDKIAVFFDRRHIGGGGNLDIVYPEKGLVARFNNSGVNPVEYGLLYVSVSEGDEEDAQPGTYTGVTYFKIALINQ